MTEHSLKLKAADAEDVEVLSAILQDAIVPLCDVAFQPDEKTFIMVAQRLKREAHEDTVPERICCAVNIRGVVAVQCQGLDLNEEGRILDLLAIRSENNTVTFLFAAGARIRLQLDGWSMFIEDFGEPWPSVCTPCHDDAAKV